MIISAKKHIYFGDGKGKTSAAAGLCARAVTYGNRVLFCAFLKDNSSGEISSLARLGVETRCVASPCFTWELTGEQAGALRERVTEFFRMIEADAKAYDLIVLDEALDAVSEGFLEESRLIRFLEDNPRAEIVITGRRPSEALQEAADYITEMRLVKHPFYSGLPAREGIEK